MGDPLNLRMTGIVISQPDLPHWATDVLQWLAMVNAMQQASGSIGKTYRMLIKEALEKGAPYDYIDTKTGKRTWMSGPSSIYGIYQSFCIAIESEANK